MRLIIPFILGYTFILMEKLTHVHKAISAIVTAVVLWSLLYVYPMGGIENDHALRHHLAHISEVIFFLIAAVTIVETIHTYGGFTEMIRTIGCVTERSCCILVGTVAFLLSSILDNLTTTAIIISVLRHWIVDQRSRWIIGCCVVIAANAGGAWTPIGDVTTTMLWIGGQITPLATMKTLFLPSFVCFLVALFALVWRLPHGRRLPKLAEGSNDKHATAVLLVGVTALLMPPLLKSLVGLPPFLGIMFGLCFLWLFIDLIKGQGEEYGHLLIPSILKKIDLTTPLFFLGILLSIAALETSDLLISLASQLDTILPTKNGVAFCFGLISALVDNVPLVAALMGMYPLQEIPADHLFWMQLAYTAGTGGSILVLGSAAGVALMSLEKIDFFNYARYAILPAFLGFCSGFLLLIL